MKLCPCQVLPSLSFLNTPIAYQDCCQPYHDGLYDDKLGKNDCVKAESAERLMRSRYSAFVLQKSAYIVETTVPAQQKLLDIEAIEKWARETDWAGLEIIAHTPNLGKRHAQVEFKAYFNTKDNVDNLEEKRQAHHELSAFVQVKSKANNDARWYFLDPTVEMNISQKQPCICGSGGKFKRCCGVYLS